MLPWNAAKAKVQLRLSVQRLRTLQQKKEAQAKAARREIATLLERGKVETAKIKVEALINEDIYAELLELLELYCELLLARFGLLDQNTREPDPGISEGVYSIIYAALRTELKELHVLREILMHKYGREFSVAVMENHNNGVSDRVMRKLVIQTPSPELVDAYLTEIAKGYNITWASNGNEDQEVSQSEKIHDMTSDDVSSGGDGDKEATSTSAFGGAIVEASTEPGPPSSSPTRAGASGGRAGLPKVEKEDEFQLLLKRFNALKQR